MNTPSFDIRQSLISPKVHHEMPYPLLKLPYGLQRRLRSLATPKETYNLQVAIGHHKSYLHPHQICFTKYSYYLYIINKGGNIILTDTSPWFNINKVLDWKNGSLRPVRYELQMYYLQKSDYDSPIFDHLLISCHKIALIKSVLNPTTFNKLVKQCKPERITEFVAVYYISPFLTVPMICDAFCNLQSLYLAASDHVTKNWLKEILNFRKLNLKKLRVGGRFDNLFGFEPQELSQLFQREDPGFYLTLNCWHPPTNAARRIRQKFGLHFEEFKSNGHGRFEEGFLIIKFGNKCAGEGYFALPTPEVITRFFFQVVPLTVN
uniref:F-box domain-containing protein n=1 Tax=Panagrellus redivivus TaxID=6233 RepID=A0A7E4WCS0_PANRE